ncbi:MAG: glycosyltransferase family 1 protein [Betaproteobacteria bacterium]
MRPAPERALRIACVTETYPPEVNGVAMTVARIVEGLRARRHVVQLVRPRQAADAQASAPHEVLVRGVPIPRYAGLRMGLPCKAALVRLWRETRPDVVHIATEGPLGRSALLAATALNLPVCSDFRTNFHAYSAHYGFGFLRRPIMGYLRRFHNATQRTMVPTQALHDQLAAAGFEKLTVVSRGVDVRQFSPRHRSDALRAAWGARPDDLVVACVGRLAPEKNLGLVISAFEEIRRRDPRARLLLVGDGPMRKELAARCPDAVFAGQRAGAELAAHYASADLFLFASVTETFGNVTTEAMASGLAVVAYEYAAAARLIRSGDNGVVVPLHDAAAFTQAALAVAADVTRCRALGLRACATAQALDWEAIVAQFEDVLAAVMRQSGETGDYAFASAGQASG